MHYPKLHQLLFIAITALSLNSCKPKELTIDELLKKHYAAVGQEKLEKVQTVAMTASMQVMGNTMTLDVYFKRPKRVRTEVHMAGATVLMVTDGDKGYMAAPYQEVREMSREEIEKSLPQNIAMDDQLYQAQLQKAKFTLLGQEKIDSNNYYKLKLDYSASNNGMDSATAYVDTKTFYLAKMITTQKINGESTTATVKFSDFRTVDGITMPYLASIRTASVAQDIPMKFEKLQYNAALSDTLFAKPQNQYAAPQP